MQNFPSEHCNRHMTYKDSNKHIIYVGPFSFPDGGAAARRILGNSQALQEAGFSVTVASGQSIIECQVPIFEGVSVNSLGERSAENLPRWLKRLAYVGMGEKTIAWLDALKKKPYALVLYSGYSPYLLRLIPWGKRNGVRLVFDAVEWYQPDSAVGYLSPYQINIELAMRWLLPRVPNIISISSFFHDHYSARGCRSTIVPPLLDVVNTKFGDDDRDSSIPLMLVYAGSPGKKDLLDNIMHAVLQVRLQGFNLKLAVAGINPSASALYPSLKLFDPSLVASTIDFVGILNHTDSMDLVRNADFSLLLRNVARYSQAGFPTKFVESFSVGTPVIANLTSDLAQHLVDGVTGFRCEGPSAEDLRLAIIRAAQISTASHAEMRRNCRSHALIAFDYRSFSASLSEFFLSARI